MQQFISERILKGFCEISYRLSVSVCVSGDGKSAKVAFGQTLLALKIYSARNERTQRRSVYIKFRRILSESFQN